MSRSLFPAAPWLRSLLLALSSQNDASAIAKMLYPQLLEKVIIINAPWFMSQLWKVATMVLSESLTGKVRVSKAPPLPCN